MASTIEVRIIGDASSVGRAFSSAAASADKLGSKAGILSGGLGLAGKAALAAGAAIGGGLVTGVGISLKKFAEFESALNTFQAVSGATAAEMETVSDKAKALGNDLTLPGTSAQDAALAMSELAKGGLDVSESMDAAKAAIQLSTAAEVDNAHAAEILADALNTFGLKGKEASHVADLLANGANATTASIDDMAMALKAVGNVANQVGLSIDETVTSLGLMAAAGLKGSDAGTSLKTMLLSLAAPTEKAAGLMEELGFKTRDMHGELLPMPALIDNWRTATEGMTSAQELAAMKTIFGTDAVRAAGAILSSEKGKWDEMADAMGRQGSAAEVAAAKSKGLAGAWDALKSALETGAITIGEKLAPAVERAVRFLGDFFSALSESKSAGEAFAAIGDAIGSALRTVGGKLQEAVNAIDWGTVGHAMFELLSAAIPPAFSGIAKVFAGVFTGIGEAIGQAIEGPLIDALQAVTANVSEAFAGVVSMIGDAVEAFDALDAALPGHPLGELADSLREVEEGLHGVADRARNFKTEQEKLDEEIATGAGILEDQNARLKDLVATLHGADGAVKVTSDGLAQMANALMRTQGEMKLADAAALTLTASYGRIPTKAETKALLHDEEARSLLQQWIAKINGTPATVETKAEMAKEGAQRNAEELQAAIARIERKTHTTSTGRGDQAIGTANRVRDAVNSVPTSHHTTFTGSVDGSLAAAAAAAGGLGGHALARGVRDFEGGWALVGEEGPEMVLLPRGSDVYSHRDTQRMSGALARMRSSHGPEVTIDEPFDPSMSRGYVPAGDPFAMLMEGTLTMLSRGMRRVAGPRGAASAGDTGDVASAPDVVVHVTVEGSVIRERDLAMEIRNQLAGLSMFTPSLWAGR